MSRGSERICWRKIKSSWHCSLEHKNGKPCFRRSLSGLRSTLLLSKLTEPWIPSPTPTKLLISYAYKAYVLTSQLQLTTNWETCACFKCDSLWVIEIQKYAVHLWRVLDNIYFSVFSSVHNNNFCQDTCIFIIFISFSRPSTRCTRPYTEASFVGVSDSDLISIKSNLSLKWNRFPVRIWNTKNFFSSSENRKGISVYCSGPEARIVGVCLRLHWSGVLCDKFFRIFIAYRVHVGVVGQIK